MLLVDGTKYKLWTPKDEEKEFHPMIRAHSKEIFGEKSLYFDVKHILKSKSGIGSIPDAYAITLSKPYQWYVVENELSTHPIYDHVIKQLTKFINGIRNESARNKILDTMYNQITKDKVLRATVEKLIGSTDIYHFLSKLISRSPIIVVFIDRKTKEVEEACQILKYQTSIHEFKTFVREDAPNVRAHLFEPLFVEKVPAMFDERREEFPFEIISKKRRIHERVTRIPKALQEILAVVKEMYRGSSFTEAVKTTAKQYGINVSTVRDKCTRQLSLNTAQFIEITRDKTRLKPLLQERFPYHKDLIMNEI